MSNSKISALTSATTPLAGTETLPVVQSSTTKQVSVANLTAGRAVSALTLNSTTGSTFATASGNVGVGTSSPAAKLHVEGSGAGTVATVLAKNLSAAASTYGSVEAQSDSTAALYLRTYSLATTSTVFGTSLGGASLVGSFGAASTRLFIGSTNATPILFGTSNVERLQIAAAGDITFTSSNIIQGTAAKGVNFTANTPAAGMTSQLLNWYEEGTWTPNQGAGLTLVGAFSSTGKYTRIGRQVSISGTVTGATSVAVTAAGVVTSNLPFTVGTAGHGDATNVAVNAAVSIICTGTSVTSAGAIAATGTITFSATYFV